MSEQQAVQQAVEVQHPAQNVNDQQLEGQEQAASSSSAPRPYYRGNNRGGYYRGGRGGGRFSNRGGRGVRYAPRGSGRGSGTPVQQGKQWVPKGQGYQQKKDNDQEQGKEASHHKQSHYNKRQHDDRGYGGRDTYKDKPQYKKKGGEGGNENDKPRQKTANSQNELQNYWRYYNQERKQPTHLIKKQDMKWDSEIPELPKNKPKQPEDQDYNKRIQAIQSQIQETQDKIQAEQNSRHSLRQGSKIQTQSKTDTEQMKGIKKKINRLTKQKQKLHHLQDDLKKQLIPIKNKLASIYSAKDKLPKQIQKYWIYTEAEARIQKIQHELQTGNLGKIEEEKYVNELELLKKNVPYLKKISSAPEEIKKQVELRNLQKEKLQQNWKKITQFAQQIDSLYNKLNQMYQKQDKKDDRPKLQDQIEKINEQIQHLREKKRELIHSKRKVDDEFYGDWIEYQNQLILYDTLTRLHKVKTAINRRKQYTEQQEKYIMDKVIQNPYQDQIDSCEQLITLLEQEIYMNKQTSGNQETKTTEQTRAPILAPKGTTQAKSKEDRMQDFELLQPTRLPGGKNKKKNKKFQANLTTLSTQSLSKKREYNLLVQFGKLDIERPENPEDYKEKLEEVKQRRDTLIEKGSNQISQIRDKQITLFRQKRQQQQKQRERGEYVPNKSRGGRGVKFRDNKGRGNYERGQYRRNDDDDFEEKEEEQQQKGRGYNKGNKGGYGRGGNKYQGKKKRYDDEDEEEDGQNNQTQRKTKEFKQYAAPAEGAEWPELQ